ncbi:hypothetical protein AWC38_SpisGene5330 [Stylophora pistillata]|uniref:Folate receptor-like domain-containing protein n=1 Tax=Stylophora pistillata TaxID=50429 RepID=A0A2B4SLT0_STYPI|nr:hypothetical protein AWC38_SpisGene5330 [Stylophora pistillata]
MHRWSISQREAFSAEGPDYVECQPSKEKLAVLPNSRLNLRKVPWEFCTIFHGTIVEHEDWLEDFNYTSSKYVCRSDSKCRKFSKLNKDGKGLCNKMWGQSFKYENSHNCMMWFAGKNPNEKVKLDTTLTTVTNNQSKLINTALALSLIKLLC